MHMTKGEKHATVHFENLPIKKASSLTRLFANYNLHLIFQITLWDLAPCYYRLPDVIGPIPSVTHNKV